MTISVRGFRFQFPIQVLIQLFSNDQIVSENQQNCFNTVWKLVNSLNAFKSFLSSLEPILQSSQAGIFHQAVSRLIGNIGDHL